MTDSVRWDLDGAVATITLNRPQARNALTAELKTELLGALGQAASSPDVRAVLITGAGQAFCAGQDLREHAGLLEAARSLDEAPPAAGAPPAGAPGRAGPRGNRVRGGAAAPRARGLRAGGLRADAVRLGILRAGAVRETRRAGYGP